MRSSWLSKISLGIVFVIAAGRATSQDFSISKLELAGNDVLVYYNLIDSVKRTYSIVLYSSNDSYGAPLQQVSGDVGLEVQPGRNKKIIWNAQKELGATFKGELGVEIRGKVYIPFVKLDGFDDYKSMKRGKTYRVTWTGGRGNSVLNFDLYRGETKITTYPNIANVGHYDMEIGKFKPGKNYKLKVSDAKNKDDVVYSSTFKVSRKVPLILPIVGAIGLTYAIITLWPDKEKDIVDPPTPNGD
jgi:hypothetical protein